MLQYYVAKFFAPQIITGVISQNENGKRKLQMFVVSDINGIQNATATLKTGRWESLGTNSETSIKISTVGS